MIKPARLTYTIGSLTFIFIGVLHSYAHLSDLSAAALLTALSDIGEVEVVGQTAQLTDLWHGISLLMGFFSVGLGAVNLAALYSARKNSYPANSICLINICLLAAITAIGLLYLGPLQAVGGPIGILLFGLPVYWASKQNN